MGLFQAFPSLNRSCRPVEFSYLLGDTVPQGPPHQKKCLLLFFTTCENGGESENEPQIKITRTCNTQMQYSLSLSNSNRLDATQKWL
jgi:hypothetical protein